MKYVKLTMATLALIPLAGMAHDGEPLNKDGCHQDERFNKYHCHAGELEGRTFDDAEQAANALIQEAIRPKNQSSAGQTEDPEVDPS